MGRMAKTINFAPIMNKGKKENIIIRAVSVGFMVAALAVFKPFGLDAWRWEAYVLLLFLWVFGMTVCGITDAILKYVLKMPADPAKGIDYGIRRNLYFQLINTPLAALLICLYRHYVLSIKAEGNILSWSNYLETLIIMAFCSFLVGLYWRYKLRNKFLALELEETKALNEQLQKIKHETPQSNEGSIVLTGATNSTVTVNIPDLLYIEAIGNYVKVNQFTNGQLQSDMIRATSKQVETDLQSFQNIIRCHRAFLVNLRQIEKIENNAGSLQLIMRHCGESIPVSRSNAAQVKEAVRNGR